MACDRLGPRPTASPRNFMKYIVRRLGSSLAVLVLLSLLAFGIVRLMPGDPAAAFFDSDGQPSAEDIAAIHAKLGLDKPWPVQYLTWIGGILRGDFGTSISTPYSVSEQLAQRLPVSLELAVLATVLAFLIGIPVGVWAARHRGGLIDGVLRVGTFTLMSVPAFVLGAVLLIVNSATIKLVLIGYQPSSVNPALHLQIMFVPALLLGLQAAAVLARYIRASMVDEYGQDYVRTLRAKGLSDRQLSRRHVLRNGLLPVTTVGGLELANLVGGTVVIERVFALPGLGSLLVQSISTNDYPTIQASILVIGTIYLLINFAVDMLHPVIDPRLAVAE
ncbi:ABC transporter permease [Pseudoclavibacter sp. CFCC 11306]|nr:ABC transporter permease [Pseudoclavibacter sp. CFCC 11306]